MPETSALTIAKIVRDARKAKGLTQKQLAEAVERNPQTISHIERAMHPPRQKLRAQLEEVLGVRLDHAGLQEADAIAAVRAALTERLAHLDASEGLMLLEHTARFMSEWEPAGAVE